MPRKRTRAPVGERELHRAERGARQPEGQLGRHRPRADAGRGDAVRTEEADEVGMIRRRSRCQKMGRPTRPCASYSVTDLARRWPTGGAVRRRTRARRAAGRSSPGALSTPVDELLEDLVDEVAEIERGDLQPVLRAFDRLDPQDLLDEVRERAHRPPLEPGGRGVAPGRRGDGQAAEVAVEAGERGAAPRRQPRRHRPPRRDRPSPSRAPPTPPGEARQERRSGTPVRSPESRRRAARRRTMPRARPRARPP